MESGNTDVWKQSRELNGTVQGHFVEAKQHVSLQYSTTQQPSEEP